MDRAARRATVRGVTRGRMWLKQLSSLWGESKSATMAWSGSLAPRFVNDWVTAEIPCSTVPACREALAWSQATLCCMHTWAPPRRQRLLPRHSRVRWVSHERRAYGVSSALAAVSARREYGHSRCASQERGCVVSGYAAVAASARRENTCAVPTPPRSPSRLLARALPPLGSANNVHSETQRGRWCHEQDGEWYTHILLHYLKNIYICLFNYVSTIYSEK